MILRYVTPSEKLVSVFLKIQYFHRIHSFLLSSYSVYTHYCETLLKPESIKHLLKVWKKGTAYTGAHSDEEHVEVAKTLLKTIGPNQHMHYGEEHDTTTSFFLFCTLATN
jgi:hypothetical protein